MKQVIDYINEAKFGVNKKEDKQEYYDIYSLRNNSKYIEVTNLNDFNEILLKSKYKIDSYLKHLAEKILSKHKKIYLMPGYNSIGEKVIKINHEPADKSFTFKLENKHITLNEFTVEYWKKNNWPTM